MLNVPHLRWLDRDQLTLSYRNPTPAYLVEQRYLLATITYWKAHGPNARQKKTPKQWKLTLAERWAESLEDE